MVYIPSEFFPQIRPPTIPETFQAILSRLSKEFLLETFGDFSKVIFFKHSSSSFYNISISKMLQLSSNFSIVSGT